MEPTSEHDPIIQAGHRRCRICGRVAFPVDAVRLNVALIIADYPALCEHIPGATVVIGLDDLPAAPPDPELSLYVRGRRCAGLNRKGRPCGSYASAGSEFCHFHRPATIPKGST